MAASFDEDTWGRFITDTSMTSASVMQAVDSTQFKAPPLALKVQLDVRGMGIYSQTGGTSPLLTIHRLSGPLP